MYNIYELHSIESQLQDFLFSTPTIIIVAPDNVVRILTTLYIILFLYSENNYAKLY